MLAWLFDRDLLRLTVTLLGIAAFLQALIGLRVISLRSPMLALTEAYLVYFSIRIPWKMVLDVTPFQLPFGRGLLLLIPKAFQASSERFPAASWIIRRRISRQIQRYNGLLILPAKGMSDDDLRDAILAFRDNVLQST